MTHTADTIIHEQDGLTCKFCPELDRFYFEGGSHGSHSISSDSSEERMLAHWSGYVENNGFEYIKPQRSGMQYDSMKELQTEISKQYQIALAKVKADYPVTRAEPTLIMINDNERVDDPIWYTGRLTKKLIDEVIASNPEIDELWCQNDIDGADSLIAMHEWSDYQPQVASVDVLIWKK